MTATQIETLKAIMKTKVATQVNVEENRVMVVYHNTEVFRQTRNRVTLNTGGWFTNTTKKRMNDSLDCMGINASVYQKDHVWYLHVPGFKPIRSSKDYAYIKNIIQFEIDGGGDVIRGSVLFPRQYRAYTGFEELEYAK